MSYEDLLLDPDRESIEQVGREGGREGGREESLVSWCVPDCSCLHNFEGRRCGV
jgi:hypothetical protein